MGTVLGLRWGCSSDEVLSAHPDAIPERSEADVQALSLPNVSLGAHLRARCVFTLWLGELVSVDVHLIGADWEGLQALMSSMAEAAGLPVRAHDLGSWTLEVGDTRVVWDRLDSRIRLDAVPT